MTLGASRMAPPKIEIRSESCPELSMFLDERIHEFNSRTTGFFDGEPFVGEVQDASGKTIAPTPFRRRPFMNGSAIAGSLQSPTIRRAIRSSSTPSR